MDKIIEEALLYKQFYLRDISPPTGGITICVRDNKIDNVILGNGWVHPRRKQQYCSLIENVLKKHIVDDINININLSDHPVNGVFNFCRVKNNNKQFLLPNHRFTMDDIQIDMSHNTFDTFDDERKYIHSLCLTMPHKIQKIYTSFIPHRSKLPFLAYSINNPDICHAYAWIGSCHGRVHLSDKLIPMLKEMKMAGESIEDWKEHLRYKYVIYLDGNTLSDRLRLLLCSDSIILKDTFSKYEEFYTNLLKPNVNYIEYSDINELKEIHYKLEENKSLCDTIINNNKIFVTEILTYNNILKYCADILNGISK